MTWAVLPLPRCQNMLHLDMSNGKGVLNNSDVLKYHGQCRTGIARVKLGVNLDKNL